MGNHRRNQVIIFSLGWIAYASTYFLRKPLGVIKADLESELSLTKSNLGWLDTALLLPYAVMQMVLGPLGDKFGARRTLGLSLIVSSLSMISFGYWSSFSAFFVLLFLNGTAQSQCWPNVTKVLMSWFSDEVRNSVFGMFGTCIFAGGVMATMLAVYVQANMGWRSTHFWPALCVMVVGILVLMFYRSADEVGVDPNSKGGGAARDNRLDHPDPDPAANAWFAWLPVL
ncbi:probable hexose phosphate transport protein [Littorina saxatilis]|uniref:probable hexose phosphate transport protein n=1 Tax=Littorina saxatilis TaxID=31220 RepID=UPI0038B643E3